MDDRLFQGAPAEFAHKLEAELLRGAPARAGIDLPGGRLRHRLEEVRPDFPPARQLLRLMAAPNASRSSSTADLSAVSFTWTAQPSVAMSIALRCAYLM